MNNPERIYQTLIGPHVSEKAVLLSEKQGQYVFKVSVTATKREIKQAIQTLLEVDVVSVRTVNVKGKVKNLAKRQGKRNNWKKAYVRLAEGQSLDSGVEA
jgi:large subunit ribosomal protein L23